MVHRSAVALALALATTTGVSADPGRNLASACMACHGTDGRSVGGMPGLAGQDRAYMARQMREFRDGKRPATLMHQIAKGYTDEQIDLIAAYFAAQKPGR